MSEKKNLEIQDEECQENLSELRIVERPEALKKALITRLNRLEGQIRGVKGMIEKGCYCDDVFTQISSLKSALNSIEKLLLDNHIKNCIAEELRAGDEEIIELLIKTIGRMMQ